MMTPCLDSAAINCVTEVCSLYKLWKPLSWYPGIPKRKKVALNNPHHQLLPRHSQGLLPEPSKKNWEIQLQSVRKHSFKMIYWYLWGGYQKGMFHENNRQQV